VCSPWPDECRSPTQILCRSTQVPTLSPINLHSARCSQIQIRTANIEMIVSWCNRVCLGGYADLHFDGHMSYALHRPTQSFTQSVCRYWRRCGPQSSAQGPELRLSLDVPWTQWLVYISASPKINVLARLSVKPTANRNIIHQLEGWSDRNPNQYHLFRYKNRFSWYHHGNKTFRLGISRAKMQTEKGGFQFKFRLVQKFKPKLDVWGGLVQKPILSPP
jgi:hypothetical protein